MMGRLTKLAANLYPRWWRERYGEEFAALLEEARPGLAGTLDTLKGALTMQLATPSSWKAVLGCATAGLIAGLAATFFVTPQYSSIAAISFRPTEVAPSPKDAATQIDIVDEINRISNTVLSRTKLSNTIRSLNLYTDERAKMPTEDVLELMRQNIRITAAPVLVGGRPVPAFQVSFQYPDGAAAQKVVAQVVALYLDENLRSQTSGEPGAVMQVLDPASLPTQPILPNRMALAVVGVGAGSLLGGTFALGLYIRRRRQAAAQLSEVDLEKLAASRRHRLTALILGVGFVVGAILGLASTRLLPQRYSSRAVLALVSPPVAPGTIDRYSGDVLSSANLSGVMRELDLYPNERTSMPSERLVELMRQNIRVTSTGMLLADGKLSPAFQITFTYPEASIATKVVSALSERFVEAIAKAPEAAEMRVVGRASQSTRPSPPPPSTLAAAGLGGGALCAAVAALLLHLRRKRQPA